MGKKHRQQANPTAVIHPSAATGQRSFPWGYVFGGGTCLVGLIVLSVALGTALRTATRGVHTLTVPGAHPLDLRKAGLYIGVYPQKGKEPVPARELTELAFFISDREAETYLPVEPAPGGAVFRQGNRAGLVLFRVEVPRAGKYIFNAAAAGGVKVAEREILLIHESLQQNKADIAAGVFFFLVCAGFGIMILIKTYRAAQKSPAGAEKRRG